LTRSRDRVQVAGDIFPITLATAVAERGLVGEIVVFILAAYDATVCANIGKLDAALAVAHRLASRAPSDRFSFAFSFIGLAISRNVTSKEQ